MTDQEIAFQKWSKYEDIAMHFNDLLMRWRLQAMGGLATLVTVAGFVVGDVESFQLRYSGMMILSITFTVVWIGMATIDLCYYRRLLRGAVEAILALEGDSKNEIGLSTKVEALAKKGGDRAPWFFYTCGLLPLVGITLYAGWRLQSPPPAEPKATCLCCHAAKP
jgi:hypothetical protein